MKKMMLGLVAILGVSVALAQSDTMMKSAARSVTTQIVRGLMGSIMGSKRR